MKELKIKSSYYWGIICNQHTNVFFIEVPQVTQGSFLVAGLHDVDMLCNLHV